MFYKIKFCIFYVFHWFKCVEFKSVTAQLETDPLHDLKQRGLTVKL